LKSELIDKKLKYYYSLLKEGLDRISKDDSVIFFDHVPLNYIKDTEYDYEAGKGNNLINNPWIMQTSFDLRKGEDWINFKNSLCRFTYFPLVVGDTKGYKYKKDAFGKKFNEPSEMWRVLEGHHRNIALHQAWVDGIWDKENKVPILYVPGNSIMSGTRYEFKDIIMLKSVKAFHGNTEEQKEIIYSHINGDNNLEYIEENEEQECFVVNWRVTGHRSFIKWYYSFISIMEKLLWEYLEQTGEYYEPPEWIRYKSS
jgi:hypothetical protein